MGLKKCWVASDPYFLLTSTICGIQVVDCWKLAVYHKLLIMQDEMGISKIARILGLQLIKFANTCLDDGIQILPSVVTVALRSTNTSSVSSSSLLPPAEGTVIHSFVDANGNSHHQVRHPVTVNKIETKKYTKTHLCKHCGDGDLMKLIFLSLVQLELLLP